MKDWPEASLSSNVFNLAAFGAPGEGERERPRRVTGKINPVGQQENLSRAARGGENVQVAAPASGCRR